MTTPPLDDSRILYLSRQEVQAACAEIDPVETMFEVFRLHASGETILPDESYLGWENAEGSRVRSLNMPAYVGGHFRSAGTKIINSNPRNPCRGIERASGLTMVFDDLTARIVCVMDAAHISSLRTASVTALAVELLRGPNLECVAVIGAGVLARAHLDLLLTHFPELTRALIFDLEEERAERLREEVAGRFGERGVSVERAPSAEAAVRRADLVVPATTTTVGYIPFGWLRPGCVAVNVSLDDLLPDVMESADLLVVDDWELVRTDPRRLLGRMYREGTLIGPDDPDPGRPCRRVDAELGDLVVGRRPGRRGPGDVVVVNPFGLAIEDVALATRVYRIAAERGMGRVLER
ncbi:MAG TPA: hypothetical protein VHG28_18600 [Longimicrobiaceae bacterium]|nr:hypothetical protein [Longimicrobiaceae bacterium]